MQFTLITEKDIDSRLKRMLKKSKLPLTIDQQKEWGKGNAYLISGGLRDAMLFCKQVILGNLEFGKQSVSTITPFENDWVCQKGN